MGLPTNEDSVRGTSVGEPSKTEKTDRDRGKKVTEAERPYRVSRPRETGRQEDTAGSILASRMGLCAGPSRIPLNTN